MAKTKKKGYGWLLAVTILWTLLALSTLIPASGASKKCMLGYKAHCTFTPVSTVICLIAAAVTCRIRSQKFVVRD